MSKEMDTQTVYNRGASVVTNLRKRMVINGLGSRNNLTSQASGPTTCSSGLVDEIWDIITISWNFLWDLLVIFSPFFAIFMAFAGFVCWNGSIVLALLIHISLLTIATIPFISTTIGQQSTSWCHFTFIQCFLLSLTWQKVRRKSGCWCIFWLVLQHSSPTPLIEFRYYTVPFFFLILHTHIDDNRSWLIMGTVYLVINCFTMFFFLSAIFLEP